MHFKKSIAKTNDIYSRQGTPIEQTPSKATALPLFKKHSTRWTMSELKWPPY